MGLIKIISRIFARKNKEEKIKNKKLDLAKQTFAELMYPAPIYSSLRKPSIDEFFVSPSEIVEQYYSDLNHYSRKKLEESIATDQQRIYGKLTDYDLRAMEYRKRTKNMSELEKRKYRIQILSKSDYLKAA